MEKTEQPEQPQQQQQDQPAPEAPKPVVLNRQVQVVPGFANIAYYSSSDGRFAGMIELRCADVNAGPLMLRDFADHLEQQVAAMRKAAEEAAKNAPAKVGPEGARMLAAAAMSRINGWRGKNHR